MSDFASFKGITRADRRREMSDPLEGGSYKRVEQLKADLEIAVGALEDAYSVVETWIGTHFAREERAKIDRIIGKALKKLGRLDEELREKEKAS